MGTLDFLINCSGLPHISAIIPAGLFFSVLPVVFRWHPLPTLAEPI